MTSTPDQVDQQPDQPPEQWPVAQIRQAAQPDLVGRHHELDLVLAALAAGRHLVLEGPPGTSKSTLLRAIARHAEVPLSFVEGNADLTPAKLLGHHDPAQVLQEGYREDNFVDGPLVDAMRHGGLLYVEEFNRAPDDTLNTLLTAMAEGEVAVPRVGTVVAGPGFRIVATMNPYDNIGTTRLSMSIRDRFNRIRVDYQDAEAEREIVARRGPDDREGPADLLEAVRQDAVALTRATRDHPAIRHGSSVRGAIDLARMASQLSAMRAVTEHGGDGRVDQHDSPRRRYAMTIHDAMVVALSGRIDLDEVVGTTPEAVLHELWEDHFVLSPAVADPGDHAVEADSPVQREGRRRGDQLQPLRRKPKELDTEPTMFDAGGGAGGFVLTATGHRRGRADGTERGDTVAGTTDEEAELLEVAPERGAVDPVVLRRAREIAARLTVHPPPRRATPRRGLGELSTVPFRGTSGTLDLDATLEQLVAKPVPEAGDLLVRERLSLRRAVMLIIDLSGSMRGERIRTAAAAVGALASEFTSDDLGVIGFWSDAAMLVRPGEPVAPGELVEQLLRIPTEGLTNVAFALQQAGDALAANPASDARVLLLSDCVHNAGPDPRSVVAKLPRLDVLCDVSGEQDLDLARDLAWLGRGRIESVSDHRAVAPALQRIFAP